MSPSNEEGATGIDNSNSIEDSLPGVRVNPARQRYQPRLRRLVVGSGIPQTVEPEDAAVAPHVRPLAMLDRPGLGPRQGRDDKATSTDCILIDFSIQINTIRMKWSIIA